MSDKVTKVYLFKIDMGDDFPMFDHTFFAGEQHTIEDARRACIPPLLEFCKMVDPAITEETMKYKVIESTPEQYVNYTRLLIHLNSGGRL